MTNGQARRMREVAAGAGRGLWRGKLDIFTGEIEAGPVDVERAPPGEQERIPEADRTLGNYSVGRGGALGAGRGGIGHGRIWGAAGSRFR